MKRIQPSIDIAIVLVFGIAFSVIGSRVGVAIDSILDGTKSMKQATRAGGAAESKTDAWYPRTEKVAAYETIVVALGNGMPTPSSASGSGSTISSGASIAPSSANEAISNK